jgi:4-amino-4-deoxy-L-arabinose transferase-like glycosyltransferase
MADTPVGLLFMHLSFYNESGEIVSMPTSVNQTQTSLGNFPSLDKWVKQASDRRWLQPLFWSALLVIVAVAVLMRLYHLNLPFDRDGYDEGVYWQSLRAMLAGLSLYHTIFYSQPPMFLLSTFPFFALFGGSLWSARFGIMLVSLLGFPGAYLFGKAVAGRLGAVVALLLLLLNPLYLAESQTIQAEASSVAFTFLALGFAFLWWKQPDGRRGILWAALAGITVVLSIFCKLLCVSTLVPIVLLLFARIWQISRRQPGTNRQSWLPILVGVGCAILTALLVIVPFLGSFQDFWSSVITFHAVAAKDIPGTLRANIHLMEPDVFSVLGLAALCGTLLALLRRDWLVLPLLAWLLVTVALLLDWHPLLPHHLIALEPPFIALAVSGVASPTVYKAVLAQYQRTNLAPWLSGFVLVLLLLTAGVNSFQDLTYYRTANANGVSVSTRLDMRAANDLQQAITTNQWVITDSQFVAGLANRSTPPALVDTSSVRIESGYLTLAQLEQSATASRVQAVLFFTSRLTTVSGFHAWVAQHFHLLHTYGPGKELWVR